MGNIANASPIADSTPYLMIAEAQVCLQSIDGERRVPIVDFYKGYKVLDMRDNEFITHIKIPKPKREATTKLYKISGHVRTRHKCKFLTKDKLFPKSINSYHNFSIKNCPKHFYVTIKSEDSSIEAIKHKKFNWEGWMWHPEREKKFNTFSKKRIIKIFR